MSRDVAVARDDAPSSIGGPLPSATGSVSGRTIAAGWPIVVAFAVFVAIWKVAALVAGLGFILPAPEVVGARFIDARADGTMEPHA